MEKSLEIFRVRIMACDTKNVRLEKPIAMFESASLISMPSLLVCVLFHVIKLEKWRQSLIR